MFSDEKKLPFIVINRLDFFSKNLYHKLTKENLGFLSNKYLKNTMITFDLNKNILVKNLDSGK